MKTKLSFAVLGLLFALVVSAQNPKDLAQPSTALSDNRFKERVAYLPESKLLSEDIGQTKQLGDSRPIQLKEKDDRFSTWQWLVGGAILLLLVALLLRKRKRRR